jgi:hypothetical protein
MKFVFFFCKFEFLYLEKMLSSDEDFRFIGTSDLTNDLQGQPFILDDYSEHRIFQGVLKLFEDRNNEVKNQAVKCLGRLVWKVKKLQIKIICDTLCKNCINKSKYGKQLDNVSCAGLKTVIASLMSASQENNLEILKNIMKYLLTVLKQGAPTPTILDIIICILQFPGQAILSVGFRPGLRRISSESDKTWQEFGRVVCSSGRIRRSESD